MATVALGVGLGSYLAGLCSGGKVELGLVPLGAVGMILGTAAAAAAIFWTPGLIATLVVIGFFSGFYIVPLYTLLQHRAPKASKGDLIATSNFINVTGAITASLLFFALVKLAHAQVTPEAAVFSGSPVSLLAFTLLPVADAMVPLMAMALAKLSLGGGVWSMESRMEPATSKKPSTEM